MGKVVLMEKWPVLGRHERAVVWLRVWADLGRAPRTMDAYARGLAEYLEMCERVEVDPLEADRAHIASYVRELAERPSRRGANVVSIDSGAGLANATLQQRMVPVRLFYDFLVEEGVRESNPVGRGRYTSRSRGGGHQRGLIPRLTKLPWIPTESQWLELLAVAAGEPVRNRVMLALAYDAALRREELCSLRTDDLDPARRMLRIRAETTKNRLERVVPYSAPTGVLLSGYLAHRASDQPSSGAVVLVGVAPQPGGAAESVDLVEGRQAAGVGGRAAAVLHAHDSAPVLDRPGAHGLGTARDRHIRRPPLDRFHTGLHPPVRPRSG